MAQPSVEYERLESYLKTLAYASRLELLAALRTPKTLDEIHLTPGASQAGENPDRPISRQAVQNHLDKLHEAGLVRVGETDRKGKRAIHEYTLDQARLFAVCEELRKVSALEPTVALDPNATEGLPESRGAASWETGAKLVLVHGVHEGRAFALKPSLTHPGRGWVIGRTADAAIALEYDPFVSLENAEVVQVGRQHRLLDLRSSRNGTFLNWRRLPVGGEATLRSGDVIGVGRSLLVFRED